MMSVRKRRFMIVGLVGLVAGAALPGESRVAGEEESVALVMCDAIEIRDKEEEEGLEHKRRSFFISPWTVFAFFQFTFSPS